jgi:hypothetical protein
MYLGEERSIQGLVENPGGKTKLGRPRRRWNDIVKLNLEEIPWYCVGCIDLAWDKDKWRGLVNVAMKFRFNTMRIISLLIEELLAI